MKKTSDCIKGSLLVLIASITCLYYWNKDFDPVLIFEGVGKLRLIVGFLYLLFGHVVGAAIGVALGFYLIIRK